MGQSPNGACYTDNPNDAVLVQGNADLKDGWVSPRVWTTEITRTAKSGDLIMSVRAPVGAMGKTAYDVVLGRGVAGIAGNEFLFQALSKKEAEEYWSTVSAGSTFDSINGDELRNTLVDCPRSELECETIGDCLSKVDSLITLHQRKRRKRLFTHLLVWEQRKFADFVTASGIRNSENLELPSYSVTNDRGFVPQDEQFENGGTMREADKTSYWIVEPKSFAYNPARINVGSIGYQSTSRNVIVSSLYEVFQADETCDNRFLWHWFKTRLFTQQIEMLQEGGVRLYFFFDKLLKSGISMPSVDEQRLIGEQFDRIDHLITLHQ